MIRSDKRRVPLVSYSGWIACAACICIAVTAVLLMPEPTENVIVNEHNVINQTVLSPQLGLPSDVGAMGDNVLSTIDSGTFFSINGMGFEGYDEFAMNEKLKFNPIETADVPDSLPVFKNLSYNPYYASYGLDERALLSEVWNVLAALDVDIFGKDLTGIKKERFSDTNRDPRGFLIPDDTVLSVTLTTGFGSIKVYADGLVEVQYTDGISLPEEYSIKDDADTAVMYICGMYEKLLDFNSPVINISEKLYESGISSSVTVYDGAGGVTEKLLSYVYRYAQFYFDADGKLTMIRLFDETKVNEMVGYYSTVSAEDAKALLLDGIYYTTHSGKATIDEAHIRGVELTYRTSDAEQVRIPFYRFYIELPPNEYSGEISYAAYYVPAIELGYINYTPDFSFNN